MSDAAPRARRRIRWAVALLLLGFVVAFVPGLAAGDWFLSPDKVKLELLGAGKYPNVGAYWTYRGVIVPSLIELVRYETGWAVAIGTLLGAPPLFVWWRRSAAAFVRATGALCCAAASLAVCLLALTHPLMEGLTRSWIWCAVPLGGALMAAAFLVAPPPRPRDDG
jgi:hypothetical protein